MESTVAGELGEILDSVLGGHADLQSLNQHVHERFPGTVSSIIILDKTSLVPVVFECAGLPEDYASAFISYYGSMNPWNAHIAAARSGTVYKTSETFPSRIFSESEYFNDFMLKNGVVEAVGIKFDAPRQELISFSGVIPSRMVGREEEQLAGVIAAVAPKLGQTISLLRRRAGDEDRSVAAAAVAARSPDAAIVLDSAFRPVFMNDIAEHSRKARGLHDIANGRIIIRDPASSAWLQTWFRSMPRGLARVPNVTFCRYRSRYFRLSLTRLPEHDPSQRRGDLRCRFMTLLQIRDLTTQPRPLEELLAAPLFRLTLAERTIAAALADGLTVSEIATAKGVSRETVRAHLKSLFHKFEVSRQSELVALLQRLS